MADAPCRAEEREQREAVLGVGVDLFLEKTLTSRPNSTSPKAGEEIPRKAPVTTTARSFSNVVLRPDLLRRFRRRRSAPPEP